MSAASGPCIGLEKPLTSLPRSAWSAWSISFEIVFPPHRATKGREERAAPQGERVAKNSRPTRDMRTTSTERTTSRIGHAATMRPPCGPPSPLDFLPYVLGVCGAAQLQLRKHHDPLSVFPLPYSHLLRTWQQREHPSVQLIGRP